MYDRSKAELSVFLEPSGLNVNSLLLRILKSAYSWVAIKLVALAPTAKITAPVNTKAIFPNDLKSFSLINLYA